MSKLSAEIERTKKKLRNQAQRKGLHENFGAKEIRQIEDKYNFIGLCYGSMEERAEAKKIEHFREWCWNFDLSCV